MFRSRSPSTEDAGGRTRPEPMTGMLWWWLIGVPLPVIVLLYLSGVMR
ncbi:MAG: hypothetical protein JWQ97_718 [Phenylobacterium sp.]|nr:hypothetical protein [Phenylobacterium sp.]